MEMNNFPLQVAAEHFGAYYAAALILTSRDRDK